MLQSIGAEERNVGEVENQPLGCCGRIALRQWTAQGRETPRQLAGTVDQNRGLRRWEPRVTLPARDIGHPLNRLEVELAAQQAIEDHGVMAEVIGEEGADWRNLADPFGPVEISQGSAIEVQRGLHVRVRVRFPGRKRTVEQGRAHALIAAAQLTQPRNERPLRGHLTWPSARHAACSLSGTADSGMPTPTR